MPRIHIMTEQVFRNRRYIDETPRQFVPASEVEGLLKREDGQAPDEHYIVLEQTTIDEFIKNSPALAIRGHSPLSRDECENALRIIIEDQKATNETQ